MAQPETPPKTKEEIDASLSSQFRKLEAATKVLESSLVSEVKMPVGSTKISLGEALERAKDTATKDEPNYGSAANILRAMARTIKLQNGSEKQYQDNFKKAFAASNPENIKPYSTIEKLAEQYNALAGFVDRLKPPVEKVAKPDKPGKSGTPKVAGKKSAIGAITIDDMAQIAEVLDTAQKNAGVALSRFKDKVDAAKRGQEAGQFSMAAADLTKMYVEMEKSLNNSPDTVKAYGEEVAGLPNTHPAKKYKDNLLDVSRYYTVMLLEKGFAVEQKRPLPNDPDQKGAGETAGAIFGTIGDKLNAVNPDWGANLKIIGDFCDEGSHAAAARSAHQLNEEVKANPRSSDALRRESQDFLDALIMRAGDIESARQIEFKKQGKIDIDALKQFNATLWPSEVTDKNPLDDKTLQTALAQTKGTGKFV